MVFNKWMTQFSESFTWQHVCTFPAVCWPNVLKHSASTEAEREETAGSFDGKTQTDGIIYLTSVPRAEIVSNISDKCLVSCEWGETRPWKQASSLSNRSALMTVEACS